MRYNVGLILFSERELTFTFDVVVRPSVVCLSVCLSVYLSSVTFVRPTQTIDLFGNVFTPFGTLAVRDLCIKMLQRSSQGNAFVRGLNPRGVWQI